MEKLVSDEHPHGLKNLYNDIPNKKRALDQIKKKKIFISFIDGMNARSTKKENMISGLV